MPGLYSEMHPYDFYLAGALTVGTKPLRVTVPYAFEIEGVSASVNTAPTGASLILDILSGPNGTAPGGLTSIFSADTTKRPTIVAGSFDNQVVTGPDQPAVTGDTASEPSYSQFVARPTPVATQQFAGNQPVSTSQPASVAVNPTEPGSANQPQAAGNVRWSGPAGSILQLAVTQIGATVAGSDLSVIVWVVEK